MVRPVRISRLWLAAVTTLAAVVLTACSGPAPSQPAANPAQFKAPPATYYLALGDSLAQGVQPNAAAVDHLATIMARLKAAAGPGVRIVGMNYYLPALAEWRSGLSGRVVAWTAEKLAAAYNSMLGRVYAKSGARVANVFGAFETADFTRPAGTNVPRNVTLLCQWTWECAAPPRGPNQHANQAGYQVIARTFLQASGLS